MILFMGMLLVFGNAGINPHFGSFGYYGTRLGQ
jgi:hypothetical protein